MHIYKNSTNWPTFESELTTRLIFFALLVLTSVGPLVVWDCVVFLFRGEGRGFPDLLVSPTGKVRLFETLRLIIFPLTDRGGGVELSDEQRSWVFRMVGLALVGTEPVLTSILFDAPLFGLTFESVWLLLSGDFSGDERQKVLLPDRSLVATVTWFKASRSATLTPFVQSAEDVVSSVGGFWEGSLFSSFPVARTSEVGHALAASASSVLWVSLTSFLVTGEDVSLLTFVVLILISGFWSALSSLPFTKPLDCFWLECSDWGPDAGAWSVECRVTTLDFIPLKFDFGNFLSSSFLALVTEGIRPTTTFLPISEVFCFLARQPGLSRMGDEDGTHGAWFPRFCKGVDVWIPDLQVVKADTRLLPCSGVAVSGVCWTTVGDGPPFPWSGGEVSQTNVTMRPPSLSQGNATERLDGCSSAGRTGWMNVIPKLGGPMSPSSATRSKDFSLMLRAAGDRRLISAGKVASLPVKGTEASSKEETIDIWSSRQKLFFLTTISPELIEQQSFSMNPWWEVPLDPRWLSLPVESGEVAPLVVPSSGTWYSSEITPRWHIGSRLAFQKCTGVFIGEAMKVWLRFRLTLLRKPSCVELLPYELSTGVPSLWHPCNNFMSGEPTSPWLYWLETGPSGPLESGVRNVDKLPLHWPAAERPSCRCETVRSTSSGEMLKVLLDTWDMVCVTLSLYLVKPNAIKSVERSNICKDSDERIHDYMT